MDLTEQYSMVEIFFCLEVAQKCKNIKFSRNSCLRNWAPTLIFFHPKFSICSVSSYLLKLYTHTIWSRYIWFWDREKKSRQLWEMRNKVVTHFLVIRNCNPQFWETAIWTKSRIFSPLTSTKSEYQNYNVVHFKGVLCPKI